MSAAGKLVVLAAMSTLMLSVAYGDRDGKSFRPVRTVSGPVSGTTSSDGSIRIYRGIPFAAPPVGELRWKAPQPVAPWSAVRRADEYGASCMQVLTRSRPPWTKEFMAQNGDSEDCLYLNVWTPASSAGKKLLMFVWIFGGGFQEGSGSVPVYDGTQLARMGMVVVTFNYRVGILGFLALPELTAESPHHSSGNYGLLDQVAALQWVKKNIAAFGGDPGRVTICGKSAGAFSVHDLVASPLAKGLFIRTIAESGSGVAAFPQPPLAEAEKEGLAFASANGLHSLKDLRAMSPAALIAAQTRARAKGLSFPPVTDGWFFPEAPDEILAEGKETDVPMITGLVANDYRLSDPAVLSADAFRRRARERYGPMADEFLKLYPTGNDKAAAVSQAESARDRERVSMYLWTLRRARGAKTPVYTYYFTQPLPDPTHPEFGAFHAGELPYVFRNLAIFHRPFTSVDYRVSDTISAYWRNFVTTGDPNGAGLPLWVAASSGNARTQEIGEHTGQIPLTSPEKRRFWTAYFDSPMGKNAPVF